MTNIGIIGNGHMGTAMINGWLRHANFNIHALVKQQCNLPVTYYYQQDMANFIATVDMIFVAVRPSSWPELKPILQTNKLKISLMAGITLTELNKASSNWVRIMPNLPVMNGEGAIGLYSHETSCPQLLDALNALGAVIPLAEESQLLGFTAIAGSGPAWLWHYLDLWQQAALELGFESEQARQIVHQTIKGSLNMTGTDDPKMLCQAVASKGGTTASGLAELTAGKDIKAAIMAANERAKELAQQ